MNDEELKRDREYLDHKEPHLLNRVCPVCGLDDEPIHESGACRSCESDPVETISYLIDSVKRGIRQKKAIWTEPSREIETMDMVYKYYIRCSYLENNDILTTMFIGGTAAEVCDKRDTFLKAIGAR